MTVATLVQTSLVVSKMIYLKIWIKNIISRTSHIKNADNFARMFLWYGSANEGYTFFVTKN
jgi:hypothetical protein